MNLYAIVNKIRLFGEPETLQEAERVMQRIGETYFAPNKDLAAFADICHASGPTQTDDSSVWTSRPADREAVHRFGAF